MKIMLRLVSLLILLTMAVALFVACGKETTKAIESDTDTDTDSDSDNDTDKETEFLSKFDKKFNDESTGDARNIRFVVGSADEVPNAHTRSILIGDDDDPDYNVNVAIINRNATVEEKLGVKIVLSDCIGMQDMATTLEPILSTALDTYDVVGGYQYFDIGLAFGESHAGFFLNYNTLPEDVDYIDPYGGYWDSKTYDTLSYKGAGYWLTGDLSLTWTGTMRVCFINSVLWANFADKIEEITGYSDIYDVITHKKWTMDTLIEISKQCWIDKDGDEKPSSGDTLGYCSNANDLNSIEIDCLASGCRVMYSKVVDGVPQIDFVNDRNTKFAEKLATLMSKSKAYTPAYGVESPRDLFTSGNVLCIAYLLSEVETENFKNMKDNYYIVPLPMLDTAQGEYASQPHDSVTEFGIPYTNEIVGATAATLEMMAYYSAKEVTPAYYDVALKDRYTRDEKSKEMIDIVHNSIYADFAWLWSDELGGVTWYFRQNAQSKSLISGIKSKQRVWSSALTTLLENLEAAGNT